MSIMPPTTIGWAWENKMKREQYFHESLCGNSWEDQDWWECYLLLKTMITHIVGYDFDIGVNICILDYPLTQESKSVCNYVNSRLSKYMYMDGLECNTTKDAVCIFKKFLDMTFPRVGGRNVFAMTQKTKIEGSARGPYGKCNWLYTYSWCGLEKFIRKSQIPDSSLTPRIQKFICQL